MLARLGAVVVALLVMLTGRESSADTSGGRASQVGPLSTVTVPFVENVGQSDPRVAFTASTFAGTVFVTRYGELVYALPAEPRAQRAGWSVTESFVGGRPHPAATELSSTHVSIFVGNDPAGWFSRLTTTHTVTLGQVYPHIEVAVHAQGKQVEKLFTVSPGGDPSAIRVHVAGARRLKLGPDGSLIMQTELGDVHLTAPVAYQDVGTEHRDVRVGYEIRGQEYGFRVGRYDAKRPLVIDPVLQATYLGGSANDVINALAISPATGAVYAAGQTWSTDFPGAGGRAQTQPIAFVARLNRNLTTLEQATYLGGVDDFGWGGVINAVGVNATTGDVYVAGQTGRNFPGTSGGAQPTSNSGLGGFVARLSADLTALKQATFLAGSAGDIIRALALVPASGEVYVAGQTASSDFPGTSGGAQSSLVGSPGSWDAFVARLNADLTTLEQATYFGGRNSDYALAIMLSPNTGDVYIAGGSSSADLPGVSGGAQPTMGRGSSETGFVARLSAGLTVLRQATYLGGSQYDGQYPGDRAMALALNLATGDVYVAGSTTATDFPGTSGGAQSAYANPYLCTTNWEDGFVARLNATLTGIRKATYLGGGCDDRAEALAVNAATGEVYVAGLATSSDFPAVTGGAQSFYGPGAFAARLNASLTAIDQATFLGGTARAEAQALALDAVTGDAYVAGYAGFPTFPDTGGGAQSTCGGGANGCYDGFVIRLTSDLSGSTPLPTATPTPTPTPGGDCCSPHAQPGCAVTSCRNATCALDSACCTAQWDAVCVNEAQAIPACSCAPPTVPPRATATPTMKPTPILVAPCVGDCAGDSAVTVDDILTMVNIALGNRDSWACLAGDANHDGQMSIDEILMAVNNALGVCTGSLAIPDQGLTEEQATALDGLPHGPTGLDGVVLPGGTSITDFAIAYGILPSGNVGQLMAGGLFSPGQRLVDISQDPDTLKNIIISRMVIEGERLASRGLWQYGTEGADKPAQDGLAYSYGQKNATVREKPPAGSCLAKVHGLDCSGLVYRSALAAGLSIPSGTAGTQSDTDVWNAALPVEWGLTMTEVTDGSYMTGDVVSWLSHIGIVERAGGVLWVLQSNGVPGPETEQCLRNRGPLRGPGKLTLSGMVSNPAWGEPATVLRLVVKTPTASVPTTTATTTPTLTATTTATPTGSPTPSTTATFTSPPTPTPTARRTPTPTAKPIRGVRLTLNSGGGGAFTLPATVEMDVGSPARSFSGSNGLPEAGEPYYSAQVEAGATFWSGIRDWSGVRGFPQPVAGCLFINRAGGSSFVAVKPLADGRRKVWVNVSVGCFQAGGPVILEWERQIRYYSGDPLSQPPVPGRMEIGTVPNSGYYVAGGTIDSYSVELLE